MRTLLCGCAFLLRALAPLGLLLAAGCAESQAEAGSPLRRLADGVAFPAVVDRAGFERELLGFGMPGYHLIVWDQGRAAGAALFRARVSDVEVLDALEALGAKPGNGLGMDSWEKRHDASSPAPDRVVTGPPVEITVRVPGREAPLRLDEILSDPGGKGFEWRFGGHRANITAWHSGCITCLYSCPGSKVGNARYVVRDYVRGTTTFRVRQGSLPADGSEVEIRLRLLPEPASAGAIPEARHGPP